MLLTDFDYELPEEAIATAPAEPRDSARLLVADRAGGPFLHHRFRDLPEFLRSGDVLVVNDTRVLAARLFGEGEGGRRFEVLLLKEQADGRWECLVRPGKRVRDGGRVAFPEGVSATFAEAPEGRFLAAFEGTGDFRPWLDRHGSMPLPPYFKRSATDADRERYQTIFAREANSVAAPTAGLHFTESLLAALESRGVKVMPLTLEVGYGTFSPIRAERIDDHRMHEERYEVPPGTLAEVEAARREGRRVIAVGTTTLRALESVPTLGPRAGTSLFIKPGYGFRRVDGLITNFHLPQSSLLVLVSAFLGRERVLAAYREALERGYRFFSYGDAMFLS